MTVQEMIERNQQLLRKYPEVFLAKSGVGKDEAREFHFRIHHGFLEIIPRCSCDACVVKLLHQDGGTALLCPKGDEAWTRLVNLIQEESDKLKKENEEYVSKISNYFFLCS